MCESYLVVSREEGMYIYIYTHIHVDMHTYIYRDSGFTVKGTYSRHI